MGYRDVRVKKSRVHTRIINLGLEEFQTVWNDCYMGNRVRVVMETEDRFWAIMVGCMTRYPLCVGANPEHWCGDGCPGHQVGLLFPSTQAGMDAWVPWSVIDGSWLVYSPRFNRLSKLSVGQARWLGEHLEVAGMGSDFIRVDHEAD